MSCSCHGASEEPCNYCQWCMDNHIECGESFQDCICPYCDICEEYTDHNTPDHKETNQ